jgi:AmmeMemoRadiSam system protein B
VLFGSPRIVPILIGDGAFDTCQRLAAALHKVAAGRPILYVASTDLSHYHTWEEARRTDERTVAAIVEGDPSRFHELAQLGPCELCGASAVTTLLLLAKLAGAKPPVLLSTATSGDATGSRSRVVGYAALSLAAAA